MSVDSTDKQPSSNHSAPKNKGLIRPAGTIFVVIFMLVLPASVYLFADSIAKLVTKTSLEAMFNAQTDLERAKVTWQPFGVEFHQLQQTDPSNPAQNLFQVEHLSAKLDIFELVLGSLIIEELKATGMQTNVDRTYPGKLFTETLVQNTEINVQNDSAKETEKAESTNIAIPDAKDVLSNTDLLTQQKTNELQTIIKEENAKLDNVIRALPNQKALSHYQKDWDRITNTSITSLKDLEQLRNDLQTLNDNIQKDKDALAAAKSQYKSSKKLIDNAISELKAAPKQDWNSIKAKYPIDDASAVSISKVLFGDKVAEYLQQGQELYVQIKPYIDAYKQVKAEQKIAPKPLIESKVIPFELDEPLPQLLIRQFTIEFAKSDNNYLLTGSELTHQNYVRNQASQYRLMLDSQDSLQFVLHGEYFVDQQFNFTTSGNWQSEQPTIQSSSIASDGAIKVNLESAHVSGSGQYSYQDQLQNKNQLTFKTVVFGGQGGTELADITLEALKNVTEFDVKFDISGEILSPSLSINSNLDKYLSAGFQEAINKRWKAFENEIQNDLGNRLKDSLDLSNEELAKIDNWQAELANMEEKIKKYGQDEVDAFVKNAKQKYEKELKDKATKKIETEKNKLEDDLKKKLKDKLKDFKCCE